MANRYEELSAIPLKPDREILLNGAVSVVQPAESESKQGPNTTLLQAEFLLAAEKRTLGMMANGASLSEVLNNLCAAIDAHAPPATSMICLMDPDGKQLFAVCRDSQRRRAGRSGRVETQCGQPPSGESN